MIFRWAKSIYLVIIIYTFLIKYSANLLGSVFLNTMAEFIVILSMILFYLFSVTYWKIETEYLCFNEVFEKQYINWESIKSISMASFSSSKFRVVQISWGEQNKQLYISPLTREYKKLVQLIIHKCQFKNNIIIDSQVIGFFLDGPIEKK